MPKLQVIFTPGPIILDDKTTINLDKLEIEMRGPDWYFQGYPDKYVFMQSATSNDELANQLQDHLEDFLKQRHQLNKTYELWLSKHRVKKSKSSKNSTE